MYFAEAFKALDCLTEDTFSTSHADLAELQRMRDDDDITDEVEIYDMTATSPEELSDSYIGKVILDCCTCHSLFYKVPDEIVIDEEQDVANIEEECPICASIGGYKIIGEVAPFGLTDSEEEQETEEVAEVQEENTVQESLSNGNAEGGFLDTGKRAGGAKKVWKDALEGKKTKTVKASDLKPGMITSTGKVTKVTDIGWSNGAPSVEVAYGGIGAQGSFASDVVAKDHEYEVLDEGIFGRKKKDIYTISVKEDNGRWTPVHSFNNKEDALKFKADYEKDNPDAKYVIHTGKKFESLTVNAEASDKSLNESIKDLSLTTDDTKLEMTSDEDGKVTVTSEPIAKEEKAEEVIAPVSEETIEVIDQENTEDVEETSTDEVIDIDMEEFDEESFDELGESFLRERYDNVSSFKTMNINETNNKLIVEGVVGFTSGKKGKTTFVFEGFTATKDNNVVFKGFNKQLHESQDSLELHGKVEGTKLIAESLVLK